VPDDYESILPSLQQPGAAQLFSTDIAESREASKEGDRDDRADVKVYADGSGAEGGAGAAAVLYKGGRRTAALRYHLGSLADHTTYEAEAVGVTLALELLSKERLPGRRPFCWTTKQSYSQ
jgi:hypothetical protein